MNSKFETVPSPPAEGTMEAVSIEPPDHDNLHITEGTVYYDILATSEAQLRRQMSENCDVNQDGKPYAAALFTDIKYKVNPVNQKGTRHSVGVEVYLRTTMRMPHFVNESSEPPDLRTVWNEMYNGLFVHEDGHRQIAIKEAEELRQAISHIPPQKSYKDLSEAIWKEYTAVTGKYELRQSSYDNCNKHGLEQSNTCL